MEKCPATPLIALIEPHDAQALPLVMTLEAADYNTVWYHTGEDLLADALNIEPDIVILADADPQRFAAWHIACALRELDCAVIMATADASARREVGITPRGAAFVAAITRPYTLSEAVQTVRRAIADYPTNLRMPSARRSQSVAHATSWRGMALRLLRGETQHEPSLVSRRLK